MKGGLDESVEVTIRYENGSMFKGMTEKKQPYLPINRMSKDEQTDRVAREIISDEKAAREEKTKRLKDARLKRNAGD